MAYYYKAMLSSRIQFCTAAINLVGTPYIYGGRTKDGCDCWGLYPATFRVLGMEDIARHLDPMWTQKAFDTLPLAQEYELAPGDAIFYGPAKDKVEHVVIHLAGGLVLSASGGSPHIKTVEAARAKGAQVRCWGSRLYRTDLLGCRSMVAYLG